MWNSTIALMNPHGIKPIDGDQVSRLGNREARYTRNRCTARKFARSPLSLTYSDDISEDYLCFDFSLFVVHDACRQL